MTDYINEKLKILKQLKIKLSDGQEKYIRSLTKEFDVDLFARGLILPPIKDTPNIKVWCGNIYRNKRAGILL